jgi:hypothetical protein
MRILDTNYACITYIKQVYPQNFDRQVGYALLCGSVTTNKLLIQVVLGYLDDITLGDDVANCLKDFLYLEAAA